MYIIVTVYDIGGTHIIHSRYIYGKIDLENI